MHGMMAPLREFLRLAKPWQRVVAGAALTVVGSLTGLYVVAAIGIVLVVLPIAGWFRGRRGSPALERTDASSEAAADYG